MITQTIDSGKHGGWAVFRDRNLVQCGLADPTKGEGPPAVGADVVLVEVPQWQPGDGGDRLGANLAIKRAFREGLSGCQFDAPWLPWDKVQNLCKTAYRGGLLARSCCCSDVRDVHPHRWKAGVPKRIHNRRVLDKLDHLELVKLYDCGVAPGLRNNVIDAIGIGLWAVGR